MARRNHGRDLQPHGNLKRVRGEKSVREGQPFSCHACNRQKNNRVQNSGGSQDDEAGQCGACHLPDLSYSVTMTTLK
jgi:hypothetical protein